MKPQPCIVCGKPAVIALGIRARKENTNAVWAPNLDAFLCKRHAEAGCVIEIVIRATGDGRVRTTTKGEHKTVQQILVIGSGVKESPGQERLL